MVLNMRFIRYYKRAYEELFLQNDAKSSQDSAVSCAKDYVSDCHRFGWLLFLALRIHAFSRFKDLVTCTNGLVSILVSLCSVFFSLFPYIVRCIYYPC